MNASADFPITIRKATLADASDVSKLGASVFTTTFGHSVTADQLKDFLQESYSVGATEADINDPKKDLFLAVTSGDEKILGFALLTRDSVQSALDHVPNKVELQRIYIDPAAQGRGVGKRLEQELVKTGQREGFEHMWLSVWDQHTKGHAVYKRWGYEIAGKKTFDVGGDVQSDFIMLKKL